MTPKRRTVLKDSVKTKAKGFGSWLTHKIRDASRGWAFWIVTSFLVFFMIYALIPTPPGVSEFLALTTLIVGRLFFVKKPLKARDIVLAIFIILVFLFGYLIMSLRYFANVHFFRLLAAGILIDILLAIWYTVSRVSTAVRAFFLFSIKNPGEKLLHAFQSTVGGIISAVVLFWIFDKDAIFMMPVVLLLATLVKRAFIYYPVITVNLIMIKIISSAFL